MTMVTCLVHHAIVQLVLKPLRHKPVGTRLHSETKQKWEIRVNTGKIVKNSRTFQGLLNDFHTVFKERKLKKNTDLHVKILLLKC